MVIIIDAPSICSTAQTVILTATSSSQVSSQSVTDTTSSTGMYVIIHVHSYISHTVIVTVAAVSNGQSSSSSSASNDDDTIDDDDDIDDNNIATLKASAGMYILLCITVIFHVHI